MHINAGWGPGSRGDGHVLPEGHPAGDLGGGVLGLGVVPGGVLAAAAVVLEGEVERRALPRADGVRVALAHNVRPHRRTREVMVALDDDRVVAVGNGQAV